MNNGRDDYAWMDSCLHRVEGDLDSEGEDSIQELHRAAVAEYDYVQRVEGNRALVQEYIGLRRGAFDCPGGHRLLSQFDPTLQAAYFVGTWTDSLRG